MRAFKYKILWSLFVSCLALFSSVESAWSETESASPDSAAYEPTPDEDVPYGIAAGYIVGHKLLRDGNVADALPYLHLAYRAQPEVVDIALDFQEALAAKGYFNDAIEVINGLHVLYPDSLNFLVQRVNLYLKSGENKKALQDLHGLRERGHVTFPLIDAEASLLMMDNKTDQAMDVYRDGLHLLPDDGPKLYLGMSGLLQKAKQDDRIAPLMDEALAKHPDVPRLWLVKARVLGALGEDNAAMETAQKADTHFASLTLADALLGSPQTGLNQTPETASGPENVPESFVVELADFYAQRGDLAKALALLQPLSDSGELGLSPSLWLGRLLLGSGRTEEGDTLVAEILIRWPDSGRAWFLKGKSAEGRGDWQASLPDFARAVTLAERDSEIRIGYVRAMLVAWESDLSVTSPDSLQSSKQDKFRRHLMVASTLVPEKDQEGQLILGYGFKALVDYERAVWRFSIAGENPDLRQNALLQQSLCYDLLGQEEKARQALETLYKDYPDHPEIANSLGYFLAEKGLELERAQALVETALAVEPGNGAYLDSMGWIYYRQGNLEKALDYLIRAVNVLPDDPVILEHLGMILLGQGKEVEAGELLHRALLQGGDPDRLQNVLQQMESGSREP